MHARSKPRGFTLVELMITVVVVGILASIAVPAYTDYVRKSRRADGKTALTRIQLQQEKWRAGHTAYAGSLTDLKLGTSSTDGHYTLTLSGASESGYTATATGGTKQQADKAGATSCASLTLTVSGNDAAYGPADCWK